MIIIFWNVDGIQVLDCVDPSLRINSEYFVQNILKELIKSDSFIKAKNQKQKFVLHMDNAPVHRSKCTQSFLKENGITVAPHPPYSPDLAPSDFYLLGWIKNNNQKIRFQSPEEIREWIQEKFATISKETLKEVFQDWKRRLTWVINNEGSYISS